MNNCSNNIQVSLCSFTTGSFDKGANVFKLALWFFVNAFIVKASWNPFMCIKIWLLRVFGAQIGSGLIIKNNVNIKFPWKLSVGDNVWLGENCWLDNLDYITIENDVCISQGALLITGNHDYSVSNFPYRNAPIVVKNGAWIGAKAIVAPGITISSHSILTLGTVMTKDTEPYGIYQGNPGIKINERNIKG